jgi:hypothetical protein
MYTPLKFDSEFSNVSADYWRKQAYSLMMDISTANVYVPFDI